MENSILIALGDSVSSKAVIDYIGNLLLCPDHLRVTLLHVLREPSAGQGLMGKRFMEEQPSRMKAVLESAREKLVESGLSPEIIRIEMTTERFPTIADGIIAYFKQNRHSMVVIGRKKMTKAEEFVLGDVSVKLVRALEGTAVLVVKTE